MTRTPLTEEQKAQRRLEMQRLAGLTPEERLADRRAKKARNRRNRRANFTPEERERFLAKERAYDRGRDRTGRVKRSAAAKGIKPKKTKPAKTQRAIKPRPVKPPVVVVAAPAPVPVIDQQPITNATRTALRVRAKRRARAESFRSAPPTPSEKLEAANMAWAAKEARRVANEARQQQEARARAWRFNIHAPA